MGGVGVIVNPLARYHRRDPRSARRLKRILGDAGALRSPGSVDELGLVAQEFCDRQIELLAVGGGDGTTSITLTHLADVYGDRPLPPLLLLRGGTMNTVANSVGAPPGRPPGLLKRLLRQLRAGIRPPHTERHALEIRSDDHRRFGFLCGCGAVYGFLAEYYADGHGHPTPRTAMTTLTRGIASTLAGGAMMRRITEPVEADVVVDGRAWPRDGYFSVAAGTIEHIGLGFRPFYRARQRPDAFHLLGIHCTPVEFVTQLLRVHRAQPMRADYVREAVAREVTLTTPNGRLDFMVDGDLESFRGTVTLALGPVIRFVTT